MLNPPSPLIVPSMDEPASHFTVLRFLPITAHQHCTFQASFFLCPNGSSLLFRSPLLSVFPPTGWDLPLWVILSGLLHWHLLYCPLLCMVSAWLFALPRPLEQALLVLDIHFPIICKITFEIVPVPLLHMGMDSYLHVFDIVWIHLIKSSVFMLSKSKCWLLFNKLSVILIYCKLVNKKHG